MLPRLFAQTNAEPAGATHDMLDTLIDQQIAQQATRAGRWAMRRVTLDRLLAAWSDYCHSRKNATRLPQILNEALRPRKLAA